MITCGGRSSESGFQGAAAPTSGTLDSHGGARRATPLSVWHYGPTLLDGRGRYPTRSVTQEGQDRREYDRADSKKHWGDDVEGDQSPQCCEIETWAEVERRVCLSRCAHARDHVSACREILWC